MSVMKEADSDSAPLREEPLHPEMLSPALLFWEMILKH